MSNIDDTLLQVFGFKEFRPGQQSVIDHILAGRSTLAVFPTGGGKSLCFQLPALHLPGLTLVVSPLIALMKDQVDFLMARGIQAFRLDSSLQASETKEIYRKIRAGEAKILYVAPERFNSERFLELIGGTRISLLAIDEAHCISEWGHNFRPEYLKLAKLARQLHCGCVLALTATATTSVAADIQRYFGIQADAYVNTGYYRPNLSLYLTHCPASERINLLDERLRSRTPGATIIYVSLQRTAEMVAESLRDRGFDVRAYHAGMTDEQRVAIQDWFMSTEKTIIVATIAFGMGIDKSNIRYIYHYNLPKNLESYSQEIGRSGRDGKAAICELLACRDDLVVLQNFVCGDTPTTEAITGLVHEICDHQTEFSISLYELSIKHDMRQQVVNTLLVYLELAGIIEATKPFYATYRFRLLKPVDEILARFDQARVAFIEQLFAAGKKARLWTTLVIDEVALALQQPRERLIAALNYMEEQGDLVVEVEGVRQGYRQCGSATDSGQLAGQLSARFLHAEEQGLERISTVLQLIEHSGCVVMQLLAYFGEQMPEPCGHCHVCQGAPAVRLAEYEVNLDEQQLIDAVRLLGEQRHQALASARQVTRFLCGLSSPATSQGRPSLIKHNHFGTFSKVPFQDILGRVEKARRTIA